MKKNKKKNTKKENARNSLNQRHQTVALCCAVLGRALPARR